MRDSSLISVVSAGEGDGTCLWFGSSLESARHMEAAPSVCLSGRSLTDGGSVWEEGCQGLAQALLSLRTVEPWRGTCLFLCGNCCGVTTPGYRGLIQGCWFSFALKGHWKQNHCLLSSAFHKREGSFLNHRIGRTWYQRERQTFILNKLKFMKNIVLFSAYSLPLMKTLSWTCV